MLEPPVIGGDRLVITVATGKAQELLAHTLPRFRAYAEKVGADFIALTNTTQTWPLAEKFRVAHYAANWNRTLYVDADVFVRSSAPDIFEAVPVGTVGIYDDTPGLLGKHYGLDWLTKELAAISESQGWSMPLATSCLNSGVVVCDRKDANIWMPPEREFPLLHCSEQNIVQTRVQQRVVSYLSEHWNFQWWANPKFEGIEHAHFIHLAGMSKKVPDMPIPILRALALLA